MNYIKRLNDLIESINLTPEIEKEIASLIEKEGLETAVLNMEKLAGVSYKNEDKTFYGVGVII